MNRVVGLLIGSVLIFYPLYSDSSKRKAGNKITCVVIDAGHGGHDSGCLGAHAKEKDVALAIALRLGKFIEDNLKDVKVVYTRKTDKFIALDERAAIANKNKADLFICIHCNSGAKTAYGIETYVMGLHKTEENLAVAKRENSVVVLEKDYKKKYEGFDPDSPEGNIIFSMYQNAYLDQSLRISSLVQKEISDFAGRHNRGVKQAGFLVLWKSTMPSTYIETGFLTNPAEEHYMVSKEGQEKIAYSIYRAFANYKKGNSAAQETEPEEKPETKDSVIKKAPYLLDTASVSKPKEEKAVEVKSIIPDKKQKQETSSVETKKPPVLLDTAHVSKPVSQEKKKEEIKVQVPDNIPPPAIVKKDSSAIVKPETKAEVPVKEIKTYSEWKQKSDSSVKVKQEAAPVEKAEPPASEEIYFTVQIATSGKPLPKNSDVFQGEKNILTDKMNGLYKYMTGKYSTIAEALGKNRELRAEKFKDAFVVAYHNGVRITIAEAQALLKKN